MWIRQFTGTHPIGWNRGRSKNTFWKRIFSMTMFGQWVSWLSQLLSKTNCILGNSGTRRQSIRTPPRQTSLPIQVLTSFEADNHAFAVQKSVGKRHQTADLS